MEQENERFPEIPVLVVDDDKDFLNSIDFALLSNGVTNVECCQDSMEVIPLLKTRKYSVILLDLKMQGITGEELLTLIVEEYPNIKVIMLTAINMVEIAVRCIKKGAFEYLVKPVDTEKLIKTIRKTLDMMKYTYMLELKEIPYYFGSYISNPDHFYGRKNQLAHIIQKIKEAENGKFWHISVIGDYRLGKSSLLKKIEYEIESKTNSISVYIDLSEFTQAYFTRSIISKIMNNLDSKFGENSLGKIKNFIKSKKPNSLNHIDLSLVGLFKIKFNPKEGNHWEHFFDALDSLINKAITKKNYKSIVLILDEINAITEWSDFREVLIKLRAIAQRTKGLNLLVGSAYPLYQLSKDEWSPFFNIFEKVHLRELTDEEADELIKSPAKEVGISYTEDAISLIKELCGNKPYYIQVLCTKIFEKLVKQRSVKNIIDSSKVEAAVEDALEQLNSHLKQMFEKCTGYQKKLLSSIANRNEDKTIKFLSDITKKDERDMLRDRVLIYKKGKECNIDGLMSRWLLIE